MFSTKIINVGSKNPVKVDAVREVLMQYEIFKGFEILSIDVESNVSTQPRSLEETIRGAKNRANAAFRNCGYSIGIESGIMEVPYTKTGFMELSACVIYDGNSFAIGLSPAFEFPLKVTKLINDSKLDTNEAFYKIGLTSNKKLGYYEGALGVLSRKRVTRKDYTKQAIMMALIQIENSELYNR